MFAWMLCAVLFLAGPAIPAEPGGLLIDTYSEFQRVGPDGDVEEMDRAEWPREILSPVALRNSHVTIRIVIKAPAGEMFHVHLAQNPEDTAKVMLYREVAAPEQNIRDRLERIEAPYAHLPPAGEPNVLSLLVDTYIPPKTPADRFRLEAQVSHKGVWQIVPFEFRVFPVTLPSIPESLSAVAGTGPRSDAPAVDMLRAAHCPGDSARGSGERNTVRAIIARNAMQDLVLAKTLEPKLGHDFLLRQAAAAAGLPRPEALCETTPKPSKDVGAEWYLKLRDFLIRAATPADFEP